MSDIATCVLCNITQSKIELTLQVWPDGESRWACRDFHACARSLAIAQDMRTRGVLHADLDAQREPATSRRHIEIRIARMHELINGEPGV